MPQPHENLGKFKLDLSQPELEKRIANARVHLTLDNTNSLSITLAEGGKSIQKKKLSHYPEEAHFQWQSKGLFRGNLSEVKAIDVHTTQLTYRDPFSVGRQKFIDTREKETSLQSVLSTLVKAIGGGLRPKFLGSFSQKVRDFHSPGLSVYELIEQLSKIYGFYFTCQSISNTVTFIRVGAHGESVNLDKDEKLSFNQLEQSGQELYREANIRFANPKNLESQDKKLAQGALYSPLTAYSGASFSTKKGWKLAQGSAEIRVEHEHDFQSNLIQYELSKRVFEQDSLTLGCFRPIGMPGDQLTVADSPAPGLVNGKYLIHSTLIEIEGALPRMTMKAIRP